jgi:hypothetical protein
MTQRAPESAAVKVRLIGEPDDVEDALDALQDALHVTRVSRPYPCRGDSQRVRVRVYVDVDHRTVAP